MGLIASIFSDFSLPNSTSWFYFSLLLSIALFFKFTRLLSMRNWDVLTLFLLVPGLLLLQEIPAKDRDPPRVTPSLVVSLIGQAAPGTVVAEPEVQLAAAATVLLTPEGLSASRIHWLGYLWLLCGSVYLLARCFLDLGLVRRPALSPNLNLSGLAWLGAALFICLVTVAIRGPANSRGPIGRRTAAVDETQRRAEDLVKHELFAGGGTRGLNPAFWVECISAVVCHLAIILALALIGWLHFQDVHSGMAAATFYVLLPYTAYHVAQVHHVLPTAFLIWTIAAYRRPTLAGALFGLAVGTGYFPVLLLPVWISFYWRHGAGRFVGAVVCAAGICLAVIALILWIDGDLARSIQAALSLSDWQAWRPPSPAVQGFWTGVHWVYRLPVFIAYLAMVLGTLFWPAPKNLAHVIALSAAAIIGIQLWFADQGGVYVLWYLPLMLLLVFRPNLSDRTAPALDPEHDWLRRWRTWLGRRIIRILHLSEPVARVQ